MEVLTSLLVSFGGFCYQMAEATAPEQCQLSCDCKDDTCDEFTLRIDHSIGQSIIVSRPGAHPVEFQTDGINQEKIYRINDGGQDLRIRHELIGQKIKAVRYRTAKTEIYCGG